MNVTDEQLRRLIASDPSDVRAKDELRRRTRWVAIRKLPARTGMLDGRPVVEDKASGYWCFRAPGGAALTEPAQYDAIVRDPPTLRERRLRALIDALAGYETPRTLAEARALLRAHREPFKLPAPIVDNPDES